MYSRKLGLYPRFLEFYLGCCIEHIFNKNAIARRGIVDQHVGHRANQFAVLDDGAAAHACHDAAGGGEQLRVSDL